MTTLRTKAQGGRFGARPVGTLSQPPDGLSVLIPESPQAPANPAEMPDQQESPSGLLDGLFSFLAHPLVNQLGPLCWAILSSYCLVLFRIACSCVAARMMNPPDLRSTTDWLRVHRPISFEGTPTRCPFHYCLADCDGCRRNRHCLVFVLPAVLVIRERSAAYAEGIPASRNGWPSVGGQQVLYFTAVTVERHADCFRANVFGGAQLNRSEQARRSSGGHGSPRGLSFDLILPRSIRKPAHKGAGVSPSTRATG